MTTELSRDAAIDLAAAIRAELPGASVVARSHDYATPEGDVAQRYSVEVVVRDARHGNVVVRTLRAPAAPKAVAVDVQREVRERARDMRTRVRAERSTDRS